MRLHQFRAITDGTFISPELFTELRNGTFAAQLRARNVPILLGECSDEHHVYSRWRPPADGSLSALADRLHADYAAPAVDALLRLYSPNGADVERSGWYGAAFGRVYADVQIHATQRGFVDALVRGGAAHLVRRYRIEWRARCVDSIMPREWGASHASDVVMWAFGDGETMALEPGEKIVARRFALDALGGWLMRGELEGWGMSRPREARRLKADGTVDIWKDEGWERGLEIWNGVLDALAATEGEGEKARL